MMAVFMVAVSLALVKPFFRNPGHGVGCGVDRSAADEYLCLREVRRALNLSPCNRTYLYLILPAAATFGVH